ncbi:27 kDa antigen Cfp30B [Streptomyces sp. YIM 130001]|uniref:VOC family protein n=1 Tax=Streptomyces sp. YIM 130001 TaxID=2259644 RepID=UPI000E65D66E|nr:VOC family protein [Streptomyces sp. YIM 130001]RII11822.1 27 kDa antigen Cfp30B [Streptomyces sp. YIM 130001]
MVEADGPLPGSPEGFPEGAPCWLDAQLPDVEAGKRFYGALFGWTFDEGAGPEYGRYAEAYSDGKRVAALAPKRDGRMPTVWNVYLATPDARAVAARIREAGGQLVTEPTTVGSYGTLALAADPEGAVFGLWQADEHPGFGKQQEPDSFCWTEVYARDKGLVDPFYEGVFGYGGFEVPDAGVPFRTWSPAGAEAGPETAVAGRSAVTGEFPTEMPAHFLVYFRVADCDRAAATAQRLGGRIRAEPFDTPFGRMAALVDDQGAVFAVMQE